MDTLRKMTEKDIDKLVQIEQAAYAYPWTKGIFQDCLKADYQAWVFVEESIFRGYGIYTKILDEAHLLNLCINPPDQGRGLSKQLLNHLIIDAKSQTLSVMYLEVRISNIKAQHLYQGFGFKQIGLRKNYYPNGRTSEDALVFMLNL